MRKLKRQIVKLTIQSIAIVAAGMLAIVLFMLVICYRGKNSEPMTDEQLATQMQQERGYLEDYQAHKDESEAKE